MRNYKLIWNFQVYMGCVSKWVWILLRVSNISSIWSLVTRLCLKGFILNIMLITQDPQWTDLNILDIGYFNSIQGLHIKMNFQTLKELVGNVATSYVKLETSKLVNIWITLQLIMLEVIRCNGDNTYVIPHINKHKLVLISN